MSILGGRYTLESDTYEFLKDLAQEKKKRSG